MSVTAPRFNTTEMFADANHLMDHYTGVTPETKAEANSLVGRITAFSDNVDDNIANTNLTATARAHATAQKATATALNAFVPQLTEKFGLGYAKWQVAAAAIGVGAVVIATFPTALHSVGLGSMLGNSTTIANATTVSNSTSLIWNFLTAARNMTGF